MKIFDTLHFAQAAVSLIDVRAGLMSPTLQAMRDIGFLEAAKRGQITLVLFHNSRPLDRFPRRDQRGRVLSWRCALFYGENFHQQYAFFEWDEATLVLLQASQWRCRNRNSQAQRNGERTG